MTFFSNARWLGARLWQLLASTHFFENGISAVYATSRYSATSEARRVHASASTFDRSLTRNRHLTSTLMHAYH